MTCALSSSSDRSEPANAEVESNAMQRMIAALIAGPPGSSKYGGWPVMVPKAPAHTCGDEMLARRCRLEL
jgi:hypothetical protein